MFAAGRTPRRTPRSLGARPPPSIAFSCRASAGSSGAKPATSQGRGPSASGCVARRAARWAAWSRSGSCGPFPPPGSASLPETGQRHRSPSRQGDGKGLPARRGLLPLVRVIDRDKAETPLERLAEGQLGLDPLSLRADIREADFDVLGPVRDEAPPQQVQAALTGPRLIADHGERVGRGHVLARSEIWRGLVRRDQEDEFDLAYLGGERTRPHT